ncbi:MAG: DUF3108 domain-containing protein [Opitutaceae bacterium]|nr:DUF3108 domain-containing protein [Opitutaceae bacterium]
MRPLFQLILLTLLLTAGTAPGASPALGQGENLTYRVSWGLFFGAGEIRIMTQQSASARGQLQQRVTTTTRTRGIVRVLFPFDARAEALFDGQTGKLVAQTETSISERKETSTVVTFDYANATASYVNVIEPARSATLPMPSGDPLDLSMCLVQTRTWNLKPGEQQDALVIFDGDFYQLTIHAVRYEEVYVGLDSFNTLLLEPRMEKTPPKGMFKRGSDVRVWISQDERRLPVKFQVEFKFGSGVATLTHSESPATTLPPTSELDAKNPRS